MMWQWYLMLKQRYRALILGDRLQRAVTRNEQAAAELDAVVRSILQK